MTKARSMTTRKQTDRQMSCAKLVYRPKSVSSVLLETYVQFGLCGHNAMLAGPQIEILGNTEKYLAERVGH